MCGIIGYVGKKDVVPLLVEGLKRLEYRGYDSAGVAVQTDGVLKVEKVNPTLQTVFVRKVVMEQQDDELTVVRFVLDQNGQIESMNSLPKRLTPYALDPL